MKSRIVFVAMLLSLLSYASVMAGQANVSDALAEDIRNNTCMPYFRALQDGDVKAIIAYSGGDMYEKYKVLLEQNPSYPHFLKKFYREVAFRPGNFEKDGNDLMVDVIIIYPNGNQNAQKLRLSKMANDSNRWKVVGVVKD